MCNWGVTEEMEGLQRRLTRMIKGLEKFSSGERLKRLGLFPLKRGQMKVDMIEIHKIMYDLGKVDQERLFSHVS